MIIHFHSQRRSPRSYCCCWWYRCRREQEMGSRTDQLHPWW